LSNTIAAIKIVILSVSHWYYNFWLWNDFLLVYNTIACFWLHNTVKCSLCY